jgi:erythritol transport system ATP-binding protein
MLAARSVSRQFPGTLALDRVDFEVLPGQVHVLVGENGAGKSTLMRILAGIDTPSSGCVEGGASGVAMIHQELNLLPNLSVADNIFLGRERTRFGIVDRRTEEQQSAAVLARLEQRIDPRAEVGQLPLGQQQIVEIAKAIARDVRVLIMDEPTSALSAAEIAVLFRLIRDLKGRGAGVVYVSHRMEELLTIGDRVTVLRDGRVVASAEAKDVSAGWIVEQMTGRTAGEQKFAAVPPGGENEMLRYGTIGVRAGEVVGFYGLMGAGRTELFETLIGLREGGPVWLDGRRIDLMEIPDRIAAGLSLVPEDRKSSGLVPTLSVRENMTLSAPKREHERAADLLQDLAVRCRGLDAPITSLSGGNQQKVLLARALMAQPKVLLLDDPTRGVDVAAREEIHNIIRRLADKGMTVLFASSELEEILDLATRVIVIARGRITADVERAEATEAALVAASGGTPVH